MHDPAYCQIPLHRRDGSVRAITTVDAEVFAEIGHYRWCLSANGYAYRMARVDGKRQVIYLHREILGLVKGDKLHGDHINRDRLDNRRSNLRTATHAENQQNKPFSGTRGASWSRTNKGWMARCQIRRKQYYLGTYDTQEEAGRIAAAFRLQHTASID
jgi:hypothetical protein